MKTLSFNLSAIALATLTFSAVAAAEKPVLNVYTYDSFASKYGPAAQLEANFEQVCNCDVRFLPFDNGVTMLNRIRLEGAKTKADVVVGIDNFTQPEAEKSGLFAENNLTLQDTALPVSWQSHTFYPYDYSEYAFIYNKDKLSNPPKSLKELFERQDLRIIYQDPRTSTVGRGLLVWANQVLSSQDNMTNWWEKLAKHTVTVGKGWSETYGAYLKGEADMVLSYTTSPLYHQWYENDDKNVAAYFEEGHLMQVELAAILKSSQQKPLAEQFLRFLHQPESQKIIAKSNIMKPVIAGEIDPLLTALPKTKVLDTQQPNPDLIRHWLADWQKAVSK